MDLNEQILRPYWLVIISLVIALLSADPIWLLIPFIVFLSIIIRYTQNQVELPELIINRRINGSRFKEADIIVIKLAIKNIGKGIFRGEIIDIIHEDSRIIEGSNIFLVKINPGMAIELSYSLSFMTRGLYKIGPIKYRYHSFGDFHHSTTEISDQNQVLIIPTPEKIGRYNLPPSVLTNLGGSFRSRLVGDGMDFSGIREYQIGDTFRRINWKQTAKSGILHSNEFAIDRASNIIIVLDLTEQEKSIADYTVRAALGMASYLMNFRCKVGMVTFSEYVHVIPLRSGKRHLIEMTEHLTRVKSINNVKNLELFKNRIRDGIQKIKTEQNEIILFSSLNDLDKARFMSEYLTTKGNLTVLTPIDTPNEHILNPVYNFSKKLLHLRNAVISNYMLSEEVKIYHWIYGIPFDNSMKQWRIKK